MPQVQIHLVYKPLFQNVKNTIQKVIFTIFLVSTFQTFLYSMNTIVHFVSPIIAIHFVSKWKEFVPLSQCDQIKIAKCL